MKAPVFFFLLIVLTGCKNDNSNFIKYQMLIKKELATSKRSDSLFMGIYLGMRSIDFYTYCWQLNNKGLFTDGENNQAVLYKLDRSELKHPAAMNFYPEFYNDKIYKMRVMFNYVAWAPWNKQLQSDTLFGDVLNLYKKWYPHGNPFLRIDDNKKGTIYVKVDDNRRIVIGRFDDMHVKVDYTDLSAEQQLKK